MPLLVHTPHSDTNTYTYEHHKTVSTNNTIIMISNQVTVTC